MKNVYFLILTGLISTILGCNPFKSDHPQSALSDEYDTDLTAKTILQYADSVDKGIGDLSKTQSLVYLLGDLSFYVEKYTSNGKPLLMIEHAYNGGNNKSLKKYYFRNDSLILEKVSTELANDDGKIFKDIRTFLRNNTVFKLENRTAASTSALNSLPFIDVPLSQNQTPDQSHLTNVGSLNDVVNGTDKFEMVFENITTYPDSRYIILKSKLQNSYMSIILVKEKDALIDSLLNDPINFKDQKLPIKWEVRDHEAIYLPSNNLPE